MIMKRLSTVIITMCVTGVCSIVFLHFMSVSVSMNGKLDFLTRSMDNMWTYRSMLGPTTNRDEGICESYYNDIGINVLQSEKNRLKLRNSSKHDSHKIMNTQVPTLKQQDIDSVKKFVFFIGYARSGHSIIASLLDAHPNIVMAQMNSISFGS